eukprot:7493032-Pyramimonas_sp.AAC.3
MPTTERAGAWGIYQSSLDARKAQNEEHQRHLQGVLYRMIRGDALGPQLSGCVVHHLNRGDALGSQP